MLNVGPRNLTIHARGMARLQVGGRLLAELSWRTEALQGVGGHVHAFGAGKEYLAGLGFLFREKAEADGGVDIKGTLTEARLAEFERWFITTRMHDSAEQRELEIGRELIEELNEQSHLLPQLSRENLLMKYCWTTKPPLENQSTQRYLEVYDVTLTPPALYEQLSANISRQCDFVLIPEAGITGSNSKLISLVRGRVPFLPGAQLVES